jgi:hypothetical protein
VLLWDRTPCAPFSVGTGSQLFQIVASLTNFDSHLRQLDAAFADESVMK